MTVDHVERGDAKPPALAFVLNFCQGCGAKLGPAGALSGHRRGAQCRVCGLVNLVRPTVSVGCLPITASGEVVLVRRAIGPGIGLWAHPGGYLELDETVAEGVIRETLEETGYLIEIGELVGVYAVLAAANVVIVFEARVVGGTARIGPEVLEVASFRPSAIPWSEIALSSTRDALLDWLHSMG